VYLVYFISIVVLFSFHPNLLSLIIVWINMKLDKNTNNQMLIHMISNFFEKSSFTLRELCFIQLKLLQKLSYSNLNNLNNLNDFTYLEHESLYKICQCYLYFIENDKKYLDYLIYTRSHYGLISYNNHVIRFRLILQEFDDDFNKLVVRIRPDKNKRYIQIDWNAYNECFPNFPKEMLRDYFELLKKMINL
jgi:hypothetical protein